MNGIVRHRHYKLGYVKRIFIELCNYHLTCPPRPVSSSKDCTIVILSTRRVLDGVVSKARVLVIRQCRCVCLALQELLHSTESINIRLASARFFDNILENVESARRWRLDGGSHDPVQAQEVLMAVRMCAAESE